MRLLPRILATAATLSVIAALGITPQPATTSNLWCTMFPTAWFCTN